MSWLFSQALVAEFSEATCSGGEPSAQLNVMPTQHKFSRLDKTMEPSQLSRFGLTCAVLTEGHGAALLTWFLAGFPARTLAKPEKESGSLASDPDYGRSSPGLFAKYDPDTSSWKTAQYSLLEGSESFSETWPRWGSMLNGESFLRKAWEPTTGGNELGLWQTPVADDAVARKAGKWNSRGEPKLSAQVMMYPTVCARDYRGPGRSRMERTGAKNGDCLPQFLGGLLNPVWTEWLMGWPIGWTELKPLETAKFQEWQQQHSPSLPGRNRRAA